MDIEEIQKATAAFEKQIEQVSGKGQAAPPPEEGVVLTPVVEAPAAAGVACMTKEFKSLVGALSPLYVGLGDVPDLMKEFIDSLPECKE